MAGWLTVLHAVPRLEPGSLPAAVADIAANMPEYGHVLATGPCPMDRHTDLELLAAGVDVRYCRSLEELRRIPCAISLGYGGLEPKYRDRGIALKPGEKGLYLGDDLVDWERLRGEKRRNPYGRLSLGCFMGPSDRAAAPDFIPKVFEALPPDCVFGYSDHGVPLPVERYDVTAVPCRISGCAAKYMRKVDIVFTMPRAVPSRCDLEAMAMHIPVVTLNDTREIAEKLDYYRRSRPELEALVRGNAAIARSHGIGSRIAVLKQAIAGHLDGSDVYWCDTGLPEGHTHMGRTPLPGGHPGDRVAETGDAVGEV